MTEHNNLSGRETEILQLVAKGLTNREIAQKLTISPNTVRVHLSNIFEKISVSSRTEATLYGIEHGIVDVPGGGEAALAPQSPGWRGEMRQYAWIGIPLILLILLFLMTFILNVLLPSSTPETQAITDLAERWFQLAPIPEARAGMAAAAYDGEVYAIAGEGPEGISGEAFRYSPDTDTWSRLSDKPTPVADVQGVLIGEKIYVPGGRTGAGNPTDRLEIYDPRRDSWGSGAPLPKAVSAYALADFEGQMYLFGGWDGERILDVVYIYDPLADEWREGTQMEIARREHGAVPLGDKIVLLGGRNESGALDSARAYFPSRDGAGEDPWASFFNLPAKWYGFAAANVSDTIFIIGGKAEGDNNEEKIGLFLSDAGWVSFMTPEDLSDRPTVMVPLGSLLIIIDPGKLDQMTQVWRYQAFYYTIYIPFVP